MKHYIALIAVLLSLNSPLVAQDGGASLLGHQAPTLQAGLDGLSFARGTLDAQLIMEIVAEKQQELKIKAIQNIFLSKVSNAGGTIYSFTNNVVRELVLEKDQSIRTKKILESTVNLVFVTAFLDYFLKTVSQNPSKKTLLIALAQNYKISVENAAKINSIRSLPIKPRTSSKIAYQDEDALGLLTMLLDMASEVVRNDDKLKQLGLMQIPYSATYEFMNKYNQLDVEIYKNDPQEKISKDSLLKVNATLLHGEMTKTLLKVTNSIGLANYIVEHFSFRNDKIEMATFSKGGNTAKLLGSFTVAGKLEDINSALNKLIASLIEQNSTDVVARNEINNLVTIQFYIKKAIVQFNESNLKKNHSDILFTIYSEFIPTLKKQSYRDIAYMKLIEEMTQASVKIADDLIKNKDSFSVSDGKVHSFILIASKLYEFDKASTISEYLKLVEDIGFIFPDDRIKNALSTVVSFIKDYTVTEKRTNGNEVINFDVESFLVKLSNIKPYRFNPWQFHFTVGVNNGYFLSDLKLDDATVIRNLSFVGEKIGLKYKINDAFFWKNRNPGETYVMHGKSFVKVTPPTEPIISNWHMVVYGSGLLYNLANIKTSKKFNSPIIALGSGLTFFNALDFNVSAGIPLFSNKDLKDSFDHPFLNIGFDIQFSEYYDRLREKQNANKIQKRLAEAIE